MSHAPQMEQVTSRIEPELRELLQARRKAAGRSESQEIRQAIQAWLGAGDRDLSASKAGVV